MQSFNFLLKSNKIFSCMSYLHRKFFLDENFTLNIIYFIIIVIVQNIYCRSTICTKSTNHIQTYISAFALQKVKSMLVNVWVLSLYLYFITISKDYLISLLFCICVCEYIIHLFARKYYKFPDILIQNACIYAYLSYKLFCGWSLSSF